MILIIVDDEEFLISLRDSVDIADDPNIMFQPGTIYLAIFMDHLLFDHQFQSNETLAKQFVAIHVAYIQKQLYQWKVSKHILIKLVVSHFGVVPFNQTHTMSTSQYLSKFCKWTNLKINSQMNEIADLKILFSG